VIMLLLVPPNMYLKKKSLRGFPFPRGVKNMYQKVNAEPNYDHSVFASIRIRKEPTRQSQNPWQTCWIPVFIWGSWWLSLLLAVARIAWGGGYLCCVFL
jgi:hypothetical protein